MRIKLNTQSIKDNVQIIAGIVVGTIVLKPTGVRFGKEHRGTGLWFSNVAANLAADGEPICFFRVIYFR